MIQRKFWNLLSNRGRRPLMDVLLENRGMDRERFFSIVEEDYLYPPYAMRDMDKAVTRISKAIREGQRIVVFGDYDADGITSTALLLDFFEKAEADATYILPHRVLDGYGIRPEGVDKAKKMGAELIVTVDNGMSSKEAVRRANEIGIDVVVTDHHLQEGELPEATAVLNPNRQDGTYPFKGLSGVGVAYKLATALGEECLFPLQRAPFLRSVLDLVALGTVTDVAPLVEENRILVKRGLEAIARSQRPGIRELLRITGNQNRSITSTTIGFHLGPRINAAGRLDRPETALRLLLTKDEQEAKELANRLNKINTQRQEMVEAWMQEAESMIAVEGCLDHRMIVLCNENWHVGVVGLMAQRLAERHDRPCIVFGGSGDEEVLTGSARSVGVFNITEAIGQFTPLLITFGGHEGASGLSLVKDQYERFRRGILTYANEQLAEMDLVRSVDIDCVIFPEEVTLETVFEVAQLEPFVEGNTEPIFMLEDVRIADLRTLSGGKHVKLWVEKIGKRFECVGWGMGDLYYEVQRGQQADVAFRLQENTWGGQRTVQFVLEDLRIW